MCVDDQQFRHFSAIKPKICKKFVIYTQNDFIKTWFVNISSFQENGELALCRILHHLGEKGLHIEGKKFYIPKFKAIVMPASMCKCSFAALNEKDLVFRMYPIEKDDQQIFAESQNQQYQQNDNRIVEEEDAHCFCKIQQPEKELFQELLKPQRRQCLLITPPVFQDKMQEIFAINNVEKKVGNKLQQDQKTIVSESVQTIPLCETFERLKPKQLERPIKDVIVIVKIWRTLNDSKKSNLTNGAKIVGMSKKSLDDYYLVLRMGEVLGFDFESNLNGMMGDLRSFIRNSSQKVSGKLSKTVVCFQLVPDFDIDKIVQKYAESGQGTMDEDN